MSVESIFGVFALLLGLIFISGVLTGVVLRAPGPYAARRTEPLAYWTFIIVWGLLALMAAWVAVQAHLTN